MHLLLGAYSSLCMIDTLSLASDVEVLGHLFLDIAQLVITPATNYGLTSTWVWSNIFSPRSFLFFIDLLGVIHSSKPDLASYSEQQGASTKVHAATQSSSFFCKIPPNIICQIANQSLYLLKAQVFYNLTCNVKLRPSPSSLTKEMQSIWYI